MLCHPQLGEMSHNCGAAITMRVGQLIGARFGSRMVMVRRTKFIRPVFLTVVLTITGKQLCDVGFK